MTPLAYALLFSLGTAAILVPLMFLLFRVIQKKKDQDMVRTIQKIADERTESQAILASLSVGIAAYGSDHRLIAANPAAAEVFGHVPDTLNQFLDDYGADNGLKASFFLEGSETSAEVFRGQKIYRVAIHPYPFHSEREGKNFTGNIITIQDFTGIRRQEEQRREFVANVSHELKTPLTTMKSYSETLLDWGIAEKTREAIREDVQRIYDDSIRMERLVSDLLLLSQIDSRRHVGSASLFDLASCAGQMCRRLKAQAEEKSIDLIFSAMSRRTPVFADKMSVERILSNLVVNAIHYTGNGGRIQVFVGTVVDNVYVKVRDNGIGISEENIENIFQRFFRVDKTGSRLFGGTGLGLPIACELAAMQHGHIEVESQLAKGSEFTLFLPSAGHLLKETVGQLFRRESPHDDLLVSAAEAIRSWVREAHAQKGRKAGADEEDGGKDNVRGANETESRDFEYVLEIIGEKVKNSVGDNESNQ